MRTYGGPQGLIASAVRILRRTTGPDRRSDEALHEAPRDSWRDASSPADDPAEHDAAPPADVEPESDAPTDEEEIVEASAEETAAEESAEAVEAEEEAEELASDEPVAEPAPAPRAASSEELPEAPADKHARILCVANQKGGVGKTTTTINLAASLADAGRSVLVVDLDPQGNATSGLGMEMDASDSNLLRAMLGDAPIAEAVHTTDIEGLDIIPSTPDLVGSELSLADALGREFLLRRALEPLLDAYHFVLVDCPPSLGLLTVNAMTAAHGLLVPVQTEYYALEGLSQLLVTIDRVRDVLNPRLSIDGVLLTMYDPRNNLSKQVEDEVRGSQLADRVYDTVIPRNVRLSEAPSFGKPALTYDARSTGAQAYLALAREVVVATASNEPSGETSHA